MFDRFNKSLFILILAINFNFAFQHSAQAITESSLKNAGFKIVPCPNYISNLKSGLASSVLPGSAICLNGNNKNYKEIADDVILTNLPLNAKYEISYPFNPINNEEGDVQSGIFKVGNFPAIIKYKFIAEDPKSDFKIELVNANDIDQDDTLVDLEGSGSGTYAVNTPGEFYLKISAYGVPANDPQPVYSVSISFNTPYYGVAVNKKKAISKGMKFKKCPAYLLDEESERIFKVGTKFTCSAKDLTAHKNAGFTVSPLNYSKALFLENNIDINYYGETVWLPFRVERPILLTYQVNDPSDGKGKTTFSLYKVGSDNKLNTLAYVKGDIAGTTTSLNTLGDYYIKVDTTPYKVEELGNINWQYRVSTE